MISRADLILQVYGLRISIIEARIYGQPLLQGPISNLNDTGRHNRNDHCGRIVGRVFICSQGSEEYCRIISGHIWSGPGRREQMGLNAILSQRRCGFITIRRRGSTAARPLDWAGFRGGSHVFSHDAECDCVVYKDSGVGGMEPESWALERVA